MEKTYFSRWVESDPSDDELSGSRNLEASSPREEAYFPANSVTFVLAHTINLTMSDRERKDSQNGNVSVLINT